MVDELFAFVFVFIIGVLLFGSGYLVGINSYDSLIEELKKPTCSEKIQGSKKIKRCFEIIEIEEVLR